VFMVAVRVELFMVLVCYYISTSLNMYNRRLNLHRQEKIWANLGTMVRLASRLFLLLVVPGQPYLVRYIEHTRNS